MAKFLAHSHEWLAQYFISPPWDPGEPGVAVWFGPAPRLSTEDAGVSYADILSTNQAYPAVTLAPTSPTLRGPLRGRVQIRVPSGGPVNFVLSVGRETFPEFPGQDHTGLSFDGEEYAFTVTSSAWESHDVDIVFTEEDLAWILEEIGPSGAISAVIRPNWNLSEPPPYQVSFIGIYAGRPTPLQWRQRTDELGVSGVRPARHASTYYATNRARGML